MGSTLKPRLQLILIFCLAVTAGIAFGAITMMIQLRRWNAAVLSLAVVVGFLLIGGAGIFSRMNLIYHNSMIIGALLAFLIFVPIVAIVSYVGLKIFLLNHYADRFADNDEEPTQVIITQSPTPAQSRALPAIIPRRSQSLSAASTEHVIQSNSPQSQKEKGSRHEGDDNKQKPGQQENWPSFHRSRRL